MQQKDNTLIISYSIGYTDWYVSEFYKFLHQKLEERCNIKFKFIPIEELGRTYGVTDTRTNNTFFNWYNFLIYNPKTDQFFAHSSDDYSVEALDDGLKRNYDIVKFSCVPDTRHDFYKKHKNFIQPSVYRFEMWSDYKKLVESNKSKSKIDKAYFIGLPYGYREMYFRKLDGNSFFVMEDKVDSKKRKTKTHYYEELSKYKYNLSLNGAAGICYRDVEIFGVGNFNLREPYTCLTYNPIEKDVHYIEMFDEHLVSEIIVPNINVSDKIADRVNQVTEFCNSKEGSIMLEQSTKWFEDNCKPENQFEIMFSIIEESSILG